MAVWSPKPSESDPHPSQHIVTIGTDKNIAVSELDDWQEILTGGDYPDQTWSVAGKKDPAPWALAVSNDSGIAFTGAGAAATFWSLGDGKKIGKIAKLGESHRPGNFSLFSSAFDPGSGSPGLHKLKRL